ncbi:MAG: hypothetical protein ACM3Y9_09445 [Ignavibacteria bacterium]
MLTVGTNIVVVKNVGPVRKGTPGVVTAVMRSPFLYFWTRRVYLCAFAGQLNVALRPGAIRVRERSAGPTSAWRGSLPA